MKLFRIGQELSSPMWSDADDVDKALQHRQKWSVELDFCSSKEHDRYAPSSKKPKMAPLARYQNTKSRCDQRSHFRNAVEMGLLVE
jgi:hypothetical protein